jgi:hypothetical protein
MSTDTSDIVIEIVEQEEEWEVVENEDSVTSHVERTEETEVVIETEVYSFLQLSEERWKEIQLLIDKTVEFTEDGEFYDALCRSTIVLLVGQLEGYIKELAKAIITDLNDNVNFSLLPKNIKKNFTSYFLGDGGRYNELSEMFTRFNPDLKIDPFLYDRNKNPSPSVIDKIMGNFGIESFFSYLYGSKLDTVFENDSSITEALINDLKTHILERTKHFPYNVDLEEFELKKNEIKFTKRNRELSLWMTFLDKLLHSRHSVAHGSIFNNELTTDLLREYEKKSKILQYAIALVLIHNISEGLQSE